MLNACRALHFHATGRLVSKSVGAEAHPFDGDAKVVRAALAWRETSTAAPLPKADVLRLVDRVLKEI